MKDIVMVLVETDYANGIYYVEGQKFEAGYGDEIRITRQNYDKLQKDAALFGYQIKERKHEIGEQAQNQEPADNEEQIQKSI